MNFSCIPDKSDVLNVPCICEIQTRLFIQRAIPEGLSNAGSRCVASHKDRPCACGMDECTRQTVNKQGSGCANRSMPGGGGVGQSHIIRGSGKSSKEERFAQRPEE